MLVVSFFRFLKLFQSLEGPSRDEKSLMLATKTCDAVTLNVSHF